MEKITSREDLIREIAEIMQMNFDECRPLLNLTTQEVDMQLDPAIVGEDCQWPHDGDEVIEIDAPTSHEAFLIMEEFAGTQPDTIMPKLWQALDGKHPFARFKETVELLGIQDQWYAFRDKWYEDIAESWLEIAEVEFKDGRIVTSGESFIWNKEDADFLL